MTTSLPLVGIPADLRAIGHHDFHAVGDKYARAVLLAAGALPVLIPAFGDLLDPAAILGAVDGLLFTGSPSNVEPHHYAGPASRPGTLHDAARDATTLPLLRLAIETGVPLLAICRGHQELNVALGGSLHQHVHEVPGRFRHRENPDDDLDVQYGPAHPVQLAPGGILAGLLGKGEITVNSLHSQAIDRLAPGLAVEATAADGTIEAVRVQAAQSFALGVQWHPEWKIMDNPDQRAILAAFGDAVRRHAASKVKP